MSVIAEAALAAIVPAVIDYALKIIAEHGVQLARSFGRSRPAIVKEIEKWRLYKTAIAEVIQDAEKKKQRVSVKEWVEDLELLLNDIENICDDLEYECLRERAEGRTIVESSSRLLFGASRPLFYRQILSQLKKASSRFEELLDRKATLGLISSQVSVTSVDNWVREPSGSVHVEQIIYGREEETQKIIEMMKNTESEAMGVIPMVGMGGIGKTTLARCVYNDSSISALFSKKIWICVSQDYNIMRIVKGIFEALTGARCEFQDFSLIEEKVKESLKSARVLIVLDDLWNQNNEHLKSLLALLREGQRGSKVVVTTRNMEVAELIRTTDTIWLDFISEEHCWNLFCNNSGLDPNGKTELNEMGRQIVKKCGGLPLAATTLGGLLRRKKDASDWEEVLNNKLLSFSGKETDMKSILQISYDDMPADLKRCFAYCATFPEDYEFKRKEVTMRWLGANLIDWNEVNLRGNLRGNTKWSHRYVDELVSRSMFIDSGDDRFKMHDLIHEMASETMGRSLCRYEFGKTGKIDWSRIRHVVCDVADFDHLLKEWNNWPGDWLRVSSLYVRNATGEIYHHAIEEHSSKLKYLRVLRFDGGGGHLSNYDWIGQSNHLRCLIYSDDKMLRNYAHLYQLEIFVTDSDVQIIPKDLGNLRSLKLLKLRESNMKELPKCIGSLRELKELKLSCLELQKLPMEMGNLSNLMKLHLQQSEIMHFPEEMGGLHNLKDLNLSHSKITELPRSLSCWSSLQYFELSNCEDLQVLPKEMGKLKNLKWLNLCGSGIKELPTSFGSLSSLEVLNFSNCHNLQFLSEEIGMLSSLKSLNLSYTGITELPKSIHCLSNLEDFDLSDCKILKVLPEEMGKLQNLKWLDLSFTGITKLPKSFGSMSSLEMLNLRCCRDLQILPEEMGKLPNLKLLDLSLTGIAELPKSIDGLSSLEDFNLTECDNLRVVSIEIGKLQSLKLLNLSFTGITELPSSIGFLGSLEVLNLRFCENLQMLPDEIGKLQKLKLLNLSHSGITELPKSFGCLSSLEDFDLRYCENLRVLPEEMGKLQSLKQLDVSYTGITELPKSFGYLRKLEELSSCCCENLRVLPEEMGMLQCLKLLDLSSTGITELPRSFTCLISLEDFTLCNCRNLRVLPEEMEKLQSLKLLNLSFTGITKLPKSFGLLSNLTMLNLRCCINLQISSEEMEMLQNFQGLQLYLDYEVSNLFV